MHIDGRVDMDPSILNGRQGFVLGCGEVIPLDSTLLFTMRVDVVQCLLTVIVLAPDGTVAVGTGRAVGLDGPVNPEGATRRRPTLVGPMGDEFLAWDELLRRSERSLETVRDFCESGQWPGSLDECRRTIVDPSLEEHAHLEGLNPLLLSVLSSSMPGANEADSGP